MRWECGEGDTFTLAHSRAALSLSASTTSASVRTDREAYIYNDDQERIGEVSPESKLRAWAEVGNLPYFKVICGCDDGRNGLTLFSFLLLSSRTWLWGIVWRLTMFDDAATIFRRPSTSSWLSGLLTATSLPGTVFG